MRCRLPAPWWFLALWLSCPFPVWAQGGSAPPYPGDPFQFGPGRYLAEYKLVLLALLFWLWVRIGEWVNRDLHKTGEMTRMTTDIWNPVVVFPFPLCFVLAGITIPLFAVGYSITFLSVLVPFLTYVLVRNSRVTRDNKVFTPSHIRNVVLSMAEGKRRKKRRGDVPPHEKGPPVEFRPAGATPQQQQAHLLAARQSPGFVTAKELIAEMVQLRAERVLMDYTPASVAVRIEVDGVWHNRPPRERESSDVMLAVLKELAGLVPQERRARQEGSFQVKFQEQRYTIHLASQGIKLGNAAAERVLLRLEPESSGLETLEDLGMRPKMRDRLKEHLAANQGLVVLSAIPDGGLRTTWKAALRATDRYMRDFISLEDQHNLMPAVENVEVVTYDSKAGETPADKLRSLLLRQPDVLVIPNVHSGQVLNQLCEWILEEKKLVITSVRAASAVEAILRLLALRPSPELFARSLTAVLNQRLVRRLCETCRIAYPPPPQLLQRLGIPPGRVEVFFRENIYQPPPEGARRKDEQEPCPSCGGIGFRGRIAIFELIDVDDALREAIVSTPRADVLRQVATRAGNLPMRDEGIALVARGITSLTELQRVLQPPQKKG